MRFLNTLAIALLGASTATSLSIPRSDYEIARRDAEAEEASLDAGIWEVADPRLRVRDDLLGPSKALEKRRGGGGSSGGGRGGSSSGGSSSGGSSSEGSGSGSSSSGSSGSSGSSSGSSSSSSGSRGSTSSSSTSGGRTSGGSGTRPLYGGGYYYGGGAAVPYAAGIRSPLGITPFLLPIGALAFFPGLWLWGAYAYPYSHPWVYNNATAVNETNPNGTNETLPVLCLCQQYAECGCDDNSNSTYIDSIVGNGTLNETVARVGDVNGTQTLVINGTLANGTTATGGTDSAAFRQVALQGAGWWVMVATVVASVLLV